MVEKSKTDDTDRANKLKTPREDTEDKLETLKALRNKNGLYVLNVVRSGDTIISVQLTSPFMSWSCVVR